MNILVTGANGFIGATLCRMLEAAELDVTALVRRVETPVTGKKVVFDFTGTHGPIALKSITQGVNAIVHTVGLTHQKIHDTESGREQFRLVNVESSRLLAEAAVDNGVSLFIYLSSVKAVGESTPNGPNGVIIPYTDETEPNPLDEYGRSKLEAERILSERLQGTNTQLVIIRPPLVYGPGQKGNMRKLFELVQRRIPLPVAGIKNARSVISVTNLCDAILTVLNNPGDSNKPYLVSDTVLSTQELVARISQALMAPKRSFSCPVSILKLAADLIGKAEEVEKIVGSLVLDDERFRADYNWQPRVDIEQAFEQIAAQEYFVK